MVRLLVVLVLAVLVAGLPPPVAGRPVAVIVRTQPAAQATAERLVVRSGGRVGRRLPLISGFTAIVPRPALTWLGRMAGVTSVTPDQTVRMAGNLYQGPDLSRESQDPDLTHLDTNGHGTHMAGIIAGRDDSTTANLADPRHLWWPSGPPTPSAPRTSKTTR